jgi:Caspase domain/Putative peptidoglycan binding domain
MDAKQLDRVLDEYEAGTSAQQIVADLAPASERELLRRCATVRSFDRGLFEDLLQRVPSPVKGEHQFERVVTNPVVQRVPRPKGTYRIGQADRPRLLGNWEGQGSTPSLRPLREELIKRFESSLHSDPVEALYQLAWLDPEAAAKRFDVLYSAAEARSDLTLCDALITLFAEPPVVSQAFRSALTNHQANMRARSLWANEFYRTGSFLDRPALVAELEGLMNSNDPARWVYQLYAPGGTGKTMFLRWALARWCVPKGVPCARIDFDHADPTLLATHPERLALEIAREWNQQIPGEPLDHLIRRLSASEAANTATDAIGQLALSLTLPDGVNALVVLDTVEEVLIPLPDRLHEILEHLALLHEKSPGHRLRVVVSGRYDLRDEAKFSKDQLAVLGTAPIHQEVSPFTKTEAREYLTKLRGLSDDSSLADDDPKKGRITAIIERCQGNPLKLWLFSEILNGEPDITAEGVRSNISVEVEYLIRRIVLRIGENARDRTTNEIPDLYKGVRWVLRYGVVARQLTLQFLEADPIRNRLFREITGRDALDEPRKGTEEIGIKEDVFPRAAGSEPKMSELWDELRKYASVASWVDAPSVRQDEAETLVFTPDVLYPMRALLRLQKNAPDLLDQQESDLFLTLHAEVLAFFRNAAGKLPPGSAERFRMLREVAYHDFQSRGEHAGPDWKKLVRSDELRDAHEWRRVLADDVTSRGFFREDDVTEPAAWDDHTRMISVEDLAFAYFVKARAYADLATTNRSEAAADWKNALTAFRLYRKTSYKLAVPPAEPRWEDASLLDGLIQVNVVGGDHDAALVAFLSLDRATVPAIRSQGLRELARLLALQKDRSASDVLSRLIGASPETNALEESEIVRLSESRARTFLVKLCGLPDDDPTTGRTAAVIELAQGNLLKLWLFSELIHGEPELTADDIRSRVSVDIAYLISRIVLRIGEGARDPLTGEIPDVYKGVRWLLRYGVIPRRLTLEFLEAEPIRTRLLNGITGRDSLDRPGKGIGAFNDNEEVFPRAGVDSDLRIQVLWAELRKFAGTSWWVSAPLDEPGDVESVIFAADALYPMRALLRREQYDLFLALHADALTFFRQRAKILPPGSPERFRELREAVYHDFQLRGELAGPDCMALFQSDEFRHSPEWRRALADDLTSREFCKDDDPTEPAAWDDHTKMISASDLSVAHHIKARALADLAAANPAEAQLHWKSARSAFRLYRKTSDKLAVPPAEPRSEETTLLDGLIQAHVDGGDREAALAAFQSLEQAADPEVRSAALRQEANLLALRKDKGAQAALERLIRARPEPKMLRDTVETLDMLARQQMVFDKLAEALVSCDRAIEYARALGASAKPLEARADLLGREVLLSSGCPERVFEERPLSSGGVAVPGSEPAEWGIATWFLKAEARLAQLDSRCALDLLREARELRRKSVRAGSGHLGLLPEKPAERQQRARIAAALGDYRRARDELSKAGAEWLARPGPDSGENADGVLASLAAIFLHKVHGLVDAHEILSRSTSGTDPAKSEARLRIELLRAELDYQTGKKEEAQAAVDRLLGQCRLSPPRFRALAAMTGLGFTSAAAQPYLMALADALAEITPTTARLVLLEPLERCPSREGLPGAVVDSLLTLLPDLSKEPPAAADRAVLGIRRADACRVVGRPEKALADLAQAQHDFESALTERKKHGPTLAQQDVTEWEPIARLEFFRANDRLGLGASAIPEARRVLPMLAQQYKGEQDLVLLATGWVEQAERAWQASDAKALDEAINEAKRLCENPRPPGMTWIASRLFRVRARLAIQSGFEDDRKQFEGTARKFEESLGLPVVPAVPGASELQPEVSSSASTGPTPSPAADLQKPLLPIHPAYSVALDWNAKEGISVIAQSLSPDRRNRSQGFWFTKELGLGQAPTAAESIASVPMAPVMALMQDWAAVARQMTGLLLGADDLAGIREVAGAAGGRADVRLTVNDPALSQLPWELVPLSSSSPGFLAASPLVRHLYRGTDVPGGDRVTMRWVQSILRQMFDRNLRVDGVDSQRLRDVIRAFQDRTELPVTGTADAETRWELERAWRTRLGRHGGSALVIVGRRPSSNTPQAAEASRTRSAYSDALLTTHVLTVGPSELPDLRLEFQKSPLRVIHVEAPFDVTASVGVRIDFEVSSDRPPEAPFTPGQLDEFLRSLPESDSKPLVILDPPMPGSPFDMVLQLFLRNAFAAELFRLGNAPVVLATGLMPAATSPELKRDLIRAGSTGATVGGLLTRIRGSLSPGSSPRLPIEKLLFPMGTALFTHDPDTRLFSELASAAQEVGLESFAAPTATSSLVTRRTYALLVGIDDYSTPSPKLRGCANDVTLFGEFLTDRIGRSPGVDLELKVLKNAEATRQAVIDGFRTHLARAGHGDVALFYFCGCGSQSLSPPEFWELEPDHLDETLVCFDSRQPGNWDLADKELAKLIDELAERGPHVTVILDCCHSGSGTRDIASVPRRAPTDLRRRPIESFLVTREELAAFKAAPDSGTTMLDSSRSRYVLFSASRGDQEAKEYFADGKYRGAFSFFLVESLKSAGGVPTYRDLFARTSAGVSSVLTNQSPELRATNANDLDAVFLDGAIQPAPATFIATFRNGNWTIDGGMSNGIPAPVGSDTTRLALYPLDARATDLTDRSKAVATARAVEVSVASSRIEVEAGTEFSTDGAFRAVVIGLPTPALAVGIEGSDQIRDQFQLAIATAGENGGPSPFIRLSEVDEPPEFIVVAREGRFDITRPGDSRPLVERLDGQDAIAVRSAVDRLQHMARWTQTARLTNPSSSIQPGDVKLAILVDGKEVFGSEVRLEYKFQGDTQVRPTFQVSLTNNSQRPLFCGLLDLTQRFQVNSDLLEAGCVKLLPGETAWGYGGRPIPSSIPDEVWQRGVIEYRDLLKLIISNKEFDARLLEQPPLDRPAHRRTAMSSHALSGTLNRHLQMVQTRDVRGLEAESIDDWQTVDVAFTTVRPQPKVAMPAAGSSVLLPGGMKLDGHPTLRASVRLMTESLYLRDLGNLRFPRLLTDDPSVCVPLTYAGPRGLDPALSVIELGDVIDKAAVTPENPLRITVPVGLAANECVIAVAYDGEFFLPVGHADSHSSGATSIAIDLLPPLLADRHSPGGSIRICLEKVTNRWAEVWALLPVLAAVEFPSGGDGIKRVTATNDIRKRVAAAERILLLVHGEVGNTAWMSQNIRRARAKDGRALQDLYDLVLTFDYAAAMSPIEESGRAVGSALEAAGLRSGSGKALDIISHSSGGLVARWFIEREGGNGIVRTLFMLGTPNAGSLWSNPSQWARVALALGFNGLTTMPWSASVIGPLAALIEAPLSARCETAQRSPLLQKLATSADPGTPYILLAGNASVISGPADSNRAELDAASRLLDHLTPALQSAAVIPDFLSQANDLAVTVTSMQSLPSGRTPSVEVVTVPCDHMTYLDQPMTFDVLLNAIVLKAAVSKA